jgi:transposase
MRLHAMRRFEGMNDEPDRSKGKTWTAEEKLRVVLEASRIPDKELGAFLRREGVHEAQLKEWIDAATAALSAQPKRKSRKPSREAKRIRELEKDLRRKEKALAEVTALLALKKKVEEIWGDGDDDTSTRSGT